MFVALIGRIAACTIALLVINYIAISYVDTRVCERAFE